MEIKYHSARGFTSITLTFHVSFLIFSCLWQPDRGPAVPKFGDWDETDPSAAEGYTQVFNLVREEKNSETGKVPVKPTETSYSSTQKEANDNAKVNMFSLLFTLLKYRRVILFHR